MRKILFVVPLLALVSACSTKPTAMRTPATFGTADRTPVYGEHHDYASMLVGVDVKTSRARVEKEVTTLLKDASVTQRLLADHDMKLAKKDAKAVDALECQLWETYATSTTTEEKLNELQHVYFDARDKDSYRWFFSLVWPKKGESPSLSLTKATFVRRMLAHHDRLCAGQKSCELQFPATFATEPFSPLDEKAILAFKSANLEKLARDKSVTLPKFASCAVDADRKTAAVEGETTSVPATTEKPAFEWKKYSFTGAGPELQDGEFVVTYDDGPHETYTPQIAQLWFDSGLQKPTFFWLARNFPRSTELGKQVHAAGFEIGCHSRNHSNLDLLSRAESWEKLGKNNTITYADELKNKPDDFVAWRLGHLNDEIVNATNEIYKALDLDVPGQPQDRLFRLPGGVGVGQPEIGKALAKIHARHYHWSIDSLDFQDPSPQSIVDRVTQLMALRKKGIILFHDIHPQSVEATRLLLEKWKGDKTIKFVPLPRTKPGFDYP